MIEAPARAAGAGPLGGHGVQRTTSCASTVNSHSESESPLAVSPPNTMPLAVPLVVRSADSAWRVRANGTRLPAWDVARFQVGTPPGNRSTYTLGSVTVPPGFAPPYRIRRWFDLSQNALCPARAVGMWEESAAVPASSFLFRSWVMAFHSMFHRSPSVTGDGPSVFSPPCT